MVIAMTELPDEGSRSNKGVRHSTTVEISKSKSSHVDPYLGSWSLTEQQKSNTLNLKHFKMNVTNTLLTKHYNINDAEKVPIIKKWQGREGHQFMQTLTKSGQGPFQMATRLFEKLNVKLKPQHDETILLLHYCKLSRQANEAAEEWIVRLTMKAHNANNTQRMTGVSRAVH